MANAARHQVGSVAMPGRIGGAICSRTARTALLTLSGPSKLSPARIIVAAPLCGWIPPVSS
jgi:hypothetical protein